MKINFICTCILGSMTNLKKTTFLKKKVLKNVSQKDEFPKRLNTIIVFLGVQIAYFAIIGTQLSMIVLSILLMFGIYKVSTLRTCC